MEEGLVIVNGVTMTLADYRKKLKENGRIKVVKRKKVKTEVQQQVVDIKKMIKSVKLMESLKAYYRNGYRQWGAVHKNIVSLNGIRKPFSMFIVKYYEIKRLVSEIERIGLRSDKAVYQYMEKLSYLVDDMVHIINDLANGISKNNICQRYENEKCIYEVGRRLGLKELLSRVFSATCDLQKIAQTASGYAMKGNDPFEFTQQTYKTLTKCWGK